MSSFSILTNILGAMDSNDSFSIAMDSGEMPGYNGLSSGHLAHGLGHPHPGPGLPHYSEHFDQSGLQSHPVFPNCGKNIKDNRIHV